MVFLLYNCCFVLSMQAGRLRIYYLYYFYYISCIVGKIFPKGEGATMVTCS